ncbi:MAG: PKD domain-containing protein [Bacteroidia bacterium]
MKKILLCFILSASLLASCTMEPTACFTVDKNSNVKENEEVLFSAACSEDANTYNWNFGDGGTASGLEAKHKYNTEGTYEVTLTAQNSSQSDLATARITVVK